MDANLRMSDPTIESGATLLVLLDSPRVQFNVRSTVQLTRSIDLTAAVYRVGPWQMGDVDGYSRVDVHGGWNVSPAVTLTGGVQNLFDRRHRETALYLYETPTEISRSAYVRASLRF